MPEHTAAPSDAQPACSWCGLAFRDAQPGQVWCSKRCKQTAWRFRRCGVRAVEDSSPRRLAYSDPPYPLKAHYYRDQPRGGSEVSPFEELRRVMAYDGWGLSTSQYGMRLLAGSLPAAAFVCPWVKSHNPRVAIGPASVHEYLIVKPARLRKPGPRDALYAAVAKGGDSDLIGRKPVFFCAWLFALLGASAADTFDDLYPGSGVVSRCWQEFVREGSVSGISAPVNDSPRETPPLFPIEQE